MKLAEVSEQGFVLTPGRYVGAEGVDDDMELFTEKMKRLTGQLVEQMASGAKPDEIIEEKLGVLGYGL